MVRSLLFVILFYVSLALLATWGDLVEVLRTKTKLKASVIYGSWLLLMVAMVASLLTGNPFPGHPNAWWAFAILVGVALFAILLGKAFATWIKKVYLGIMPKPKRKKLHVAPDRDAEPWINPGKAPPPGWHDEF